LLALRTTLALLDGNAHASSAKRSGSTISQAMALDAARLGNGNGHSRPAGKPSLLAQRQRTAALLAQFDRTEPRRSPGRANIGVLIHRGYLVRQGDGFVRTDKPYVVDRSAALLAEALTAPATKASKKPGYWSPAATAARRKRTAALLATFSPTKPTAPTDAARRGFGALIASGYLKRRPGGYVRTAKVFTP
jgi:hypothetical protein